MTVPAVAAVVAMTTGAVRPAPIEPSIPHDFADPTVLSVDGTYYAYSTTSRYGARNFHVPVQSSRLLTGGNGKYVLFYSGNAYNSGRYFINYATADELCDQFAKHQRELLNEHTLDDAYQNPGGQDVLHTHRHDFLVFHAYTTPTRRAMFVAEILFATPQDGVAVPPRRHDHRLRSPEADSLQPEVEQLHIAKDLDAFAAGGAPLVDDQGPSTHDSR